MVEKVSGPFDVKPKHHVMLIIDEASNPSGVDFEVGEREQNAASSCKRNMKVGLDKYSWRPIITVYSDRPSIHYLPISDAFVKKDYFFCFILMIQLWHYWEIACSISTNKIFFHFYNKHSKWGDEVMNIVSPIIHCSMVGLIKNWFLQILSLEGWWLFAKVD